MEVAQNVPTIVLKNYNKVFSNYCSFFSAWCDERSCTKNWGLGIFDSHSKISKLKINFCRKITKNTKKKVFFLQFFFEFLKNLIAKRR